MKRFLFLVLCCSSVSVHALTCYGELNGSEVAIDTKAGVLAIAGRTVATFSKSEMDINLLKQSITVENSQGYVRAKLKSLSKKTGVIKEMQIYAEGIDASGIPIDCD